MFYVESALLELELEHIFCEDSRRKKKVQQVVNPNATMRENLKKLNYDPKSGTAVIDGKRVNLNITQNPNNTFALRLNRHGRKRESMDGHNGENISSRGGVYVSDYRLRRPGGAFVTGHEFQHNVNQLPYNRALQRRDDDVTMDRSMHEFTPEERKVIAKFKKRLGILRNKKTEIFNELSEHRRNGTPTRYTGEDYKVLQIAIQKIDKDLREFITRTGVGQNDPVVKELKNYINTMNSEAKSINGLLTNRVIGYHGNRAAEVDADSKSSQLFVKNKKDIGDVKTALNLEKNPYHKKRFDSIKILSNKKPTTVNADNLRKAQQVKANMKLKK